MACGRVSERFILPSAHSLSVVVAAVVCSRIDIDRKEEPKIGHDISVVRSRFRAASGMCVR